MTTSSVSCTHARAGDASSEAPQAEQFQMVLTVARLCQVGHDLPHDAAELEAMSREPSGDTDLRKRWMQVEDEMLVWGVGEEAGLERHRRPRGIGEIACREAA